MAKNQQKQGGKKVLLLIDWDNLFINLFNDLGHERMQIEKRIEKMMDWIKTEIGELLGGYGFVFAPEHLSLFDRKMCTDNGLTIIISPKKEIPDSNKQEDTVDEKIIWFANLMADHPEVKYLCLVSGDSDYIDMLKDVKQKGVKVALVIPTMNSFSRMSGIALLADVNSKKEKMVLLLEEIL